ncbi:MAG: LapA family protein [Rhodobacteraceae bacterium]|nr:LapA family protein [Paracoccaceae bacterium]MCY4197349.1 LapA family protein [Paracoccaceae bacterium]MCY4327149.1 LapA family protein [Paracoccaceae bacterium]
MSLLRWSFLSIIGILLIFVALANRDMVALRLVPDEYSALFPMPRPVELPLFLVIFAGIVLGLLIGFIWEWMRERRHRREVTVSRREIAKLESEIGRLKKEQNKDSDDILALLE